MLRRFNILPTSSWGGGPAKLVEGFFDFALKNPSTAFGGPPPRQLPGRMIAASLLLSFATAAAAQDKLVPYWASIASGEAMTRKGPAKTYPGIWLYKRRDLPVRVLKRHEHWRLIEDPDGTRGWMLHSLLSERRSALVKPGEPRPIYAEPSASSALRYRAEAGVVGRIEQCGKGWCRFKAGNREGYVRVGDIWGVAPNEPVK